MLSWPYYGLGSGGIGMSGMGMAGMGVGGLAGMDAGPRTITHDRVPAGKVEVSGGQPVQATDGDIGRVKELVIDPADHHVRHVLLDEGHRWGRQTVAIPIDAVADVNDGVQLGLTKD